MKISRSLLWFFGFFLSFAVIQGCALLGGGDQEELGQVEEMEGDEENQQEGDEDSNEESNGNAAFNANDTMANLATNDAGMLGAEGMGVPENGADDGMNMAIPSESNMSGMEDLNSLMNQSNGDIAGAEPSMGMAAAPGMGMGMGMGMDPAPMEAIPTDPSMANMAMPSAAPTVAAAIAPGDARVYYVIPGGAELKDGPNGNTISTLAQGEPCLAKIEGEWANLTNRGFIKITQLSTTPIGREQKALAWQ